MKNITSKKRLDTRNSTQRKIASN